MTADAATPDPRCEICGKIADHSTETCCSSHGKVLCHSCYRRTHFVEVCSCGLCNSAPDQQTQPQSPPPGVDKPCIPEVLGGVLPSNQLAADYNDLANRYAIRGALLDQIESALLQGGQDVASRCAKVISILADSGWRTRPNPVLPSNDNSPSCTCGTALDWIDDQWHCPECGDEFAPDEVLAGRSNDNSPSDASTDDHEDSQSNTTRQSAGDGFRNNELAGRSNDEPTPSRATIEAIERVADAKGLPANQRSQFEDDEPTDDPAARLAAYLDFAEVNRPGVDHLQQVSYEKHRIGNADLRAVLARLEAVTTELAKVTDARSISVPRRSWERAKAAEAETLRLRQALIMVASDFAANNESGATPPQLRVWATRVAAVLGGTE